MTETLVKASAAAVHAAGDAGATGNLDPFKTALSSGANANLCEALAGMLIDRPYSAIELSVGWALNRPPPAHAPATVRVTSDVAPFLRAAAQEMRARAPRDDFELEGYVVALDNDDVRSHGGTITVVGELDGGTRRVRLKLSAGEYPIALDAHGRMARVGCAGRLTKAGGPTSSGSRGGPSLGRIERFRVRI